ncbi:MAG: NADH-quinone oxidoreductase subunit NuoF [Candidatus Caldatribacteriota bacterium]|nr:NADH-quinone oxidoreductase subunit NuoF [Candidatus Caldatribacteriota bacterium]
MLNKNMAHILVGIDGNTILSGSRKIKTDLITELNKQGLSEQISVIETGSIGPINQGVVIGIYPTGEMYGNLVEEDIPGFIQERFIKGRPYKKLLLNESLPSDLELEKYDSRKHQYIGRIVLDNCGRINPESIEEYIGVGGYEVLGKVLKENTPDEIIQTIKDSGLRGRGGAGFPTGLKWSFTAQEKGSPKYVICNADEGEPGTFKDRLIMEGDPHKILEGMAICGYAIGANFGYIYIRGEYKLCIQRLKKAIEDAEELGLLGKNIFNSGFDFQIEIKIGAGSYVCGEETALLSSMEGFRGEPKLKPPYPAESGFLSKPTNVNNVETLANIAPIILKGSDWFKKHGTKDSPGTKVYTILGHINRPGLIEVPMGVTLREIVYDYAGGMSTGQFKMAQIGGTAGDVLSEKMMDIHLDYKSLQELDHNLGSGALLIMNDSVSVTSFMKWCMKFYVHESCGRCSACRIGTRQLYESFKRLEQNEGYYDELTNIKELAKNLHLVSFCPLGQSISSPVLSALKYFEEELSEGVDIKKIHQSSEKKSNNKTYNYS